MDVMENIRQCIGLQVPEVLPVFCMSEHFDAKYCGLGYAEYVASPDNIIQCQLEVIEKFGWDWAWLHLDDFIEIETLGVDHLPGALPTEYLKLDAATVSSLKIANPITSGRMPILTEAISGLRSVCGDTRCITGRVVGPFSLVTLIFGPPAVLAAMRRSHKVLQDALAFAADMAIAWGAAQLDAGAHAIWVGDCTASTAVLGAENCEKWSLPFAARVCTELREYGGVVFLDTAEDGIIGLELQARAEPSALNVGAHINMAAALERLGPEICLMGNIDPVDALVDASASQVASETDNLVRAMVGGGAILNTGGAVPRNGKLPNMHTMLDTGRKVWDLAHGRR